MNTIHSNLFPHSHTEYEIIQETSKKEHLISIILCIYACTYIHTLHYICAYTVV